MADLDCAISTCANNLLALGTDGKFCVSSDNLPTDQVAENTTGVYTHTSVDGTALDIDTRANSNPYTPGNPASWDAPDPTTVSEALDILVTCCPDETVVAVDADFADPLLPTDAEATALATGSRPGTMVTFVDVNGFRWSWVVDKDGNAIMTDEHLTFNVVEDVQSIPLSLSSTRDTNGGTGQDTILTVNPAVFQITNPFSTRARLDVTWGLVRILGQFETGIQGNFVFDGYVDGVMVLRELAQEDTFRANHLGAYSHTVNATRQAILEMAPGQTVDLSAELFWSWGAVGPGTAQLDFISTSVFTIRALMVQM